MRVSVVVPTFNRATLLKRTLPAYAAQVVPPGTSYEVLIVSDGSTDETPRLLAEWTRTHGHVIRFLHNPPTGGPAAPRNAGIRAATGDVVLICDDDVSPEPQMVAAHAAYHLAHPEPEAAGLGEAYVPEDLLSDPMSLFHTFPYDEVRRLPRLSFLHFWTCNVSVKRSFMLEHGMFDEGFLYHEDIVCGYDLERAGMHLRFVPEARGQHLHQLRPAGIPSKGLFTGLWLYPFLERVPDVRAKIRYGVIDRSLPPGVLVKRLVNRTAFWLVDNPLTSGVLRLLGATNGRRSRASDAYYYLEFRRHIRRGYAQARRRALAERRPPQDVTDRSWVNRGEG